MTPTPAWLPLLAIASGLGFSLIAISYKLGEARQVAPRYIALVISIAGSIFYGIRSDGRLIAGVPAEVWITGAVVGVGQYACVRLIAVALARGPLSPMWCAVGLGFLPAVLYAAFYLGERLGVAQVCGVLAGIGCIVVASFEETEKEENGREVQGGVGARVVYGIVLFLLLALNGMPNATIKYFGARLTSDGQNYMYLYGDSYLFFLYFGLAVLLLADVLLARAKNVPWRSAVALGCLAGAGSIGGLWALSRCSVLPAALVFTGSGVASLLSATLVSVFFLGEKRTPIWYGTVGLAVLAIMLVNMP